MRRGKKNNAFTAALGEELTTRKVLEKAKDREETRVIMSGMEDEFVSEIIAEPIDSGKPIFQSKIDAPVRPAKRSKPRAEKLAEKKSSAKISTDKKSAPEKSAKKIPPVKLEAENEFEERIFAEAENDFYDEKIPQNVGKNMRSKVTEKISDSETEIKSPQNAYRSKFYQKQFEDLDAENIDAENDDAPDFDPELHRKLTRAEMAGVGISALMLLYAYDNADKPLFFLALSLLIHLMRPLIGAFFGKKNRAVQNAMRSFSWVLFIGSLVFLFVLN